MTTEERYNFPKRGINRYVAEYIGTLTDLSGKVVLDIPCGDGRACYEFIKKGAEVKAFDLFPCFMKLKEIKAEYADLTEILPIESNSVDYIICQEGIEHVPNQLKLLEEFNRVLKEDGILLITTPNYSQVSARLSRFFLESDYWQRMPPTEIDSIWFAENDSNKLYFGHLFLLGVQHFQSLLTIAGFKTKKRIKTEIGNTSLILGIVLYPLFVCVTLVSWMFYRRKNTHVEQVTRDKILWKRVKLNLLPKTLFCKHIFWVLGKENELHEVVVKLKKMHRK
jgi:SAM-dependent methyltransferase